MHASFKPEAVVTEFSMMIIPVSTVPHHRICMARRHDKHTLCSHELSNKDPGFLQQLFKNVRLTLMMMSSDVS